MKNVIDRYGNILIRKGGSFSNLLREGYEEVLGDAFDEDLVYNKEVCPFVRFLLRESACTGCCCNTGDVMVDWELE